MAAGVFSGVPSTAHALATGRDPLASIRAAGNVVLPASSPPHQLLAAGLAVHAVLSLTWGTVLSVVLSGRLRSKTVWGAAAGLVIAALDLGVAGRRRPLVAALPVVPQVADHVAFGAIAGAVLDRHG